MKRKTHFISHCIHFTAKTSQCSISTKRRSMKPSQDPPGTLLNFNYSINEAWTSICGCLGDLHVMHKSIVSFARWCGTRRSLCKCRQNWQIIKKKERKNKAGTKKVRVSDPGATISWRFGIWCQIYLYVSEQENSVTQFQACSPFRAIINNYIY